MGSPSLHFFGSIHSIKIQLFSINNELCELVLKIRAYKIRENAYPSFHPYLKHQKHFFKNIYTIFTSHPQIS